MKEETRCRHMGCSFRLTARVHLHTTAFVTPVVEHWLEEERIDLTTHRTMSERSYHGATSHVRGFMRTPTCFKGVFKNVQLKAVLLTYFCMVLRSTRTMNSLLDGMPRSTSAFSRRSKCGPSKVCSFFTWSSFDISANSLRKPCRSLKKFKIN